VDPNWLSVAQSRACVATGGGSEIKCWTPCAGNKFKSFCQNGVKDSTLTLKTNGKSGEELTIPHISSSGSKFVLLKNDWSGTCPMRPTDIDCQDAFQSSSNFEEARAEAVEQNFKWDGEADLACTKDKLAGDPNLRFFGPTPHQRLGEAQQSSQAHKGGSLFLSRAPSTESEGSFRKHLPDFVTGPSEAMDQLEREMIEPKPDWIMAPRIVPGTAKIAHPLLEKIIAQRASVRVYAASFGGILNETTMKLSTCMAPNVEGAEYAQAFASVPVEIRGHGPFRQIAVGSSNICTLTDDARIFCWGKDKVPYMNLRCRRTHAAEPPRAGSSANALQYVPGTCECASDTSGAPCATCVSQLRGKSCYRNGGKLGACSNVQKDPIAKEWQRKTGGQFKPSSKPKWGPRACHPSCKTCLPGNSDKTGCTSCPEAPIQKTISTKWGKRTKWGECEKPCHHTVLTPKNNAGTCHRKHCHYCKPRECCGSHHKQFIIDADAMAGVCVRHTDDCSPLCVFSKATKKRVCSKGCNNMLRLHGANRDSLGEDDSMTVANDAQDTLALSACQADKVVQCPASGVNSTAVASIHPDIALPVPKDSSVLESCANQKSVLCKTACSGLSDEKFSQLYQIGSTCLINMQLNLRCFGDQVDPQVVGENDSCDDVRERCPHFVDAYTEKQTVNLVRAHCSLDRCNVESCKSLALSF